MRIFNKLAQRYLIRRSAPLPLVGPPGPDLIDSADWTIARAAVGDAYQIRPSADPSLALGAEGATVVLDAVPHDAGSGRWLLQPVAGDNSYQYILDTSDRRRALRVADRAEWPSPDLEIELDEIDANDPAAMWRIEEECVADARSIHLRYSLASDAALFYNEIYPFEAPPGTFFCTSGFGTDSHSPGPCGYAGIQRRADSSQIAIFSVWHRMAGGETPVANGLATIVAMHPDAHGTAFAGEGSGSSIRFPLSWQVGSGEPVRFALTAEALGKDTVLSAYVGRGDEPWISIGAILRAKTGGRSMNGLYAFIEDFARTGNTTGVAAAERSPYQVHSGVFANPWVSGSPAKALLQPLSETRVTVYSPHPLENLSAELAERAGSFGVFLATGTSRVAHPSPIGITITDSSPDKRWPPNLGGVPWL